MTRVLYFDCFSGISGDMMLGALLDLGIDEGLFLSEVKKLNLEGCRIEIIKKVDKGIRGTDIHVITEENGNESHYARNIKDIFEIIENSSLAETVKSLSKKVFKEIARAEAKVHDADIEDVHFHEVGAIDSIIDIVGVSICLNLLGIERIFSSPLHDGKGFTMCSHGVLPIPVPAVIEMLSGSNIPYITEDVNAELVTPTGMGFIKTICSSFGNMPAMIIDKVGYGHGKKDIGRPNSLRVVMGSLFEEKGLMEEIALLETNIDDMSPEILAYAMEKLLENGALDVYYSPVYMKKGRIGVVMSILTNFSTEEKLVDIVLRETSSIGVRRSVLSRYVMDRKIESVKTEYGDINVKIASANGATKVSPEYENCKDAANQHHVPLRKVYEAVNRNLKN